jgi:ectoine hydroxylase-related dioxygenase (phytanoyl-CoA dioxygenase family)
MSEAVDFFAEHGYLVVDNALNSTEVEALNSAIDADRAAYPSLWQARGEGGRLQSVTALLSSRAFDATIRHAAVLPLVEAIMGPELCFEEFSVMLRQAYAGEPLAPLWHRDTAHWTAHELCVKNVSVVYYLTDVDATSHCFAIVPESVEEKKSAPDERSGDGGVELYGAAGTAILFNAASCHAGIVKETARQRRTIHIYYGHRSQPVLSNHTLVPRRLLASADEGERQFYGRPNLMTELVRDNF